MGVLVMVGLDLLSRRMVQVLSAAPSESPTSRRRCNPSVRARWRSARSLGGRRDPRGPRFEGSRSLPWRTVGSRVAIDTVTGPRAGRHPVVQDGERPDSGALTDRGVRRGMDDETTGPGRGSPAPDRAASDRDALSDRLDADAAVHDESSDRRDTAANTRDGDARARQSAAPATTDDGAARSWASRDRRASAADRARSAAMRLHARADRAAAAAERASHDIDETTGAYRRDSGARELVRDCERSRRTRVPMVIGFVDVDGLKAVNDTLGHEAGDRVLREIVREVRANVREYDLIVRYGGDEFVLSMVGASSAMAESRLLRVNENLIAQQRGSISFGIVTVGEGDDVFGAIARADRSLYEQRRNRRR